LPVRVPNVYTKNFKNVAFSGVFLWLNAYFAKLFPQGYDNPTDIDVNQTM